MTDESNPFRAEIEQILIDHPFTRYARVLRGMLEEPRLTDAEMAEEACAAGDSIGADSIARVRRIVRLTLEDALVADPSEAKEQASLYRALIDHPHSPGLLGHVRTRVTQLRKLVGPAGRTWEEQWVEAALLVKHKGEQLLDWAQEPSLHFYRLPDMLDALEAYLATMRALMDARLREKGLGAKGAARLEARLGGYAMPEVQSNP